MNQDQILNLIMDKLENCEEDFELEQYMTGRIVLKVDGQFFAIEVHRL